MGLFKNVNVVSIHVKDWEGAKKFYRDLLGWPIAYSDEQMGWEEYGEEGAAHVSISRWNDPANMPPAIGGTTLVLTVEDAFKTTEELRARGIKCDDAVAIPGVVSFGTLYDPEGNCIQFASEAPPPA
jgi:predicted enzyme related to lactoylglutathione lyase